MALILQTEKVGEVTFAKLKDGKPLYVDDAANNVEVAYDAEAARTSISRLNGEAMGHRQAKEAAELALKPFEGLDLAAAKTALETVANLDAGSLLTAGKVDEIKQAAVAATTKGFEARMLALQEKERNLTDQNKALTGSLHGEKIGNKFATSKYIGDKLAVPADMVQKVFGEHFKVEDDAVVAYDAKGVKLYSQEKPGELAGFDEALGIIIGGYPHKDTILKGKGHTGGGGLGPDGKPLPLNAKEMKRADFDKLDPATAMAKMREGIKVID